MMDYGFYTQYLYGFTPKWACGLRYEYVWASNYSLNSEYVEVSHNEDPFRDDRHRVSPLLAWYLTEFSRFDFQYNFDYAQHLPEQVCAFLLAGGRVHARFAPGPQVLEPFYDECDLQMVSAGQRRLRNRKRVTGLAARTC